MNDIVNPLQNTSYTNKDFTSVYVELLDLVKQLTSKWEPGISNESDPGVVLLKLNAIIADKCNYSIDKNVLECFPLSVTQETNARHLFEQLGYYMHWYKSATTQVALTWVGEDSDASNSGYYIIPAFTMVTDSDNSVVYTLVGPYEGTTTDTFIVGDMQLPCSGSNRTIRMKAIQGVAVDYTIGGSVLITPDKLDDKNRLYFDTNDIAQNGIFISNVNRNNYSQWIQKDNLLIENIGNTYYTFGVTDDGANCYLQFPDDVYNLFEDGVVIKYIKTDNVYGNISANTLSKFHVDFTAYDEQGNVQMSVNNQQIQITGENVKVTNTTQANNGLDKESINEAYKGYKSTVGTFDTLVTLRDYINSIRKSGLVSNDFVCDRTNDIQTSYKIIPAVSDSDAVITIQEEDNGLDAFTLKIYATQYVLKPQTKADFNNSFYMLPNKAQDNIKSYIENQKTILHDFGNLLTPDEEFSHICYFKNKYPIECTIIPQSNLSNVQKNIILNNIKQALYENLNASQVEFGDEISYQFVYDVIKNADNRISAVSLNTIQYETYAVYYSEGETITYNDSDDSWYDDNGIKVNPEQYLLYPSNPADGAVLTLPAHFRELLISTDDDTPIVIDNSSSNFTVDVDQNAYMETIDCDDWYKKQTFECATSTAVLKAVKQTDNTYSQDATPFEAYSREDFLSIFGVTIPQNTAADTNIKFTVTLSGNISVSPSSVTVSDQSKLSAAVAGANSWCFKYKVVDYNYTWELDGTTVDLDDYGITINDTYTDGAINQIQQGEEFSTKVSLKTQMRNEIYAKSVLAGKTQFFIQDETFDYRLNQKSVEIIDDVNYLSTNVDITFNQNYPTTADTQTVYNLKDNEYLQFYVPNFMDGTSYSTYVKMEYVLNSPKNANTNFELQPGEFIIFYWKTSSEDDGSLNDYAVYSYGNIFNTSFTIPQHTDTSDIVGYNLLERDINGNILDSSSASGNKMTVDISNQVDKITNAKNILSGTKKLTLKKVAQIGIDQYSGYYMYWITNSKIGNRYRLFNALPQYQSNIAYDAGTLFAYDSKIYVVNSDISSGSNTSFSAIEDNVSLSVQSRVLNQGEYFIYTDSTQTNMSILGAGTKITRDIADLNWDVTAIDATDITSIGVDIFYNQETEESYWFTDVGLSTVTLIENQFITISPGMWVKITPNNLEDVYALTQTKSLNASYSNVTTLDVSIPLFYSKLQEPLTGESKQLDLVFVTETVDGENSWHWELDGNKISLDDYGLQINRLNVEYDVEASTTGINRGTYMFTYLGSNNWDCNYHNMEDQETVPHPTYTTTQMKSNFNFSTLENMFYNSTLQAGDVIYYNFLTGDTIPAISLSPVYTNGDKFSLFIWNKWQVKINSEGYVIITKEGQHENYPTLADFNIEYRTADAIDYTSLPDVSLQSLDGWEAYSLLAVNTNNILQQKLYKNQTISYKIKNSDDWVDITPCLTDQSIPISDLTDTSWVFNSIINTGIVSANTNYNLEFNIDGIQYNYIKFSKQSVSLDNAYKDMYYGTTTSDYILVYDAVKQQWVNEKYRYINITGGSSTTTTTVKNLFSPYAASSVYQTRYNARLLNYYPTLLSSDAINNFGGVNLDVSSIDEEGNVTYPSLYIFETVNSQDASVSYSSDGGVLMLFTANDSTKEIELSIPVGNYILPLRHNYENISSLTVQMITYNGFGSTTTTLHNMGDEGLTNFNVPSAYFIYLPVETNDTFTIKVSLAGHNRDINIKLDNCYKYVKPKNMTQEQFDIIQQLIFKLSTDLKYKYTYVNDSTKNIENPLDPFQFLNSNHIYNQNTICQMDDYSVTWG